ncbi:MAG: 8-amino-7-oxononanoate synthase [Ottowia sp.]|nr:8-amino-7-oxononanoate synthase [Ottowia sp.]
MPTFESAFLAIQAGLEQSGHWRILPTHEPATCYADFSHNDYLGFAQDAELVEASHASAQRYGMGATGSRLLSGNLPPHLALENLIAQSKGTQAALTFQSGYQANATVLAALLDKKVLGTTPLVFSDRLNHASLHHACQLMGVREIRYQHNNLTHLRSLLEKYSNDPSPKFIVTETVFGMDGDMIDMPAFAALADTFDAFLYLDEAHATGIIGPDGYGLSSGWINQRGLAMGTFSKALGVSGAYIACSQVVYNYLVNRCQGFIYTTALSPAIVGAVHAAWSRLPTLTDMRTRLLGKAHYLRQHLHALGFNTGTSNTHIIPLIVGHTTLAFHLQAWLQQHRLLTSIIRPPTVPPHTARVRIALSATHQDAHIDALIAALTTWRAP